MPELTPPIDRVLGVTGISVSTDDRYASVSFHLNPEGQNTDWHYSRLRLMASVADSTLTPALIINTDTIAPYSISNNCTSHIPDSIPPLSPTLYYTYTIPYSADFGTITLIPNDILYRARQHDSHFHDTVHTDTTILSADTTLTLDGELNIGLESDNASVVNRSDITFPNTIVDDKLFTINGIIPETDNNGITLHSIGVNGASLPSWLRCADFAQQIQMLKPDLVIMAVGVNDANVGYGRFDKNEYIANYNLLIDRIYAVNPNCAIIFVTNNDCVLRTGRRSHGPNKNTALVAEAMTSLARQHNGAVWNLYDIMGGLGSMAVWRDNGLANPDRVHFLAPGYTILGDMLYNAIIYDWLYKQKSE